MSASWMYVTALKMERTRAAASLDVDGDVNRRMDVNTGCSRFVVVAFGAYAIEEFTASAEIEDEVEIVRGL